MRTHKNTMPKAIIRIIVGVMLIAASLFVMITTHQKHDKCSYEVSGVVESIEEKKVSSRASSRPVTEYRPVIAFEYNGSKYTVSGFYDKNNYYRQGQDIKVMIDPDHPTEFYIPGKDSIWYAYFLTLPGLAFIVFGVLSIKRLRNG